MEKSIRLKIGAKVILAINLDAEDRLINGQTENISNIEFAHGSVRKVYVNVSDKQVGLNATRSSYPIRQNSLVSIEKWETEIPVKKGLASPSIKCTQFLLQLAW